MNEGWGGDFGNEEDSQRRGDDTSQGRAVTTSAGRPDASMSAAYGDLDKPHAHEMYEAFEQAYEDSYAVYECHKLAALAGITAAQGIDARSGATACGRDPEDESPVAESDAPKGGRP